MDIHIQNNKQVLHPPAWALQHLLLWWAFQGWLRWETDGLEGGRGEPRVEEWVLRRGHYIGKEDSSSPLLGLTARGEHQGYILPSPILCPGGSLQGSPWPGALEGDVQVYSIWPAGTTGPCHRKAGTVGEKEGASQAPINSRIPEHATPMSHWVSWAQRCAWGTNRGY